ncbi:unnamed protein product [Sphagnum jensenii]
MCARKRHPDIKITPFFHTFSALGPATFHAELNLPSLRKRLCKAAAWSSRRESGDCVLWIPAAAVARARTKFSSSGAKDLVVVAVNGLLV